jgi:hypothetical protein
MCDSLLALTAVEVARAKNLHQTAVILSQALWLRESAKTFLNRILSVISAYMGKLAMSRL